MINNSFVVLGVKLGSREIGISVFQKRELIFYAVKSIKRMTRRDSTLKLQEVIKNLIGHYYIDFIALEKAVFVQQRNAFVMTATGELGGMVGKTKVKLIEYHPKFVRKAICGFEKPTKKNTALLLAQKYNELVGYFNVPRLWQKRYYAQLFDAIAVGLVCAEEINK